MTLFSDNLTRMSTDPPVDRCDCHIMDELVRTHARTRNREAWILRRNAILAECWDLVTVSRPSPNPTHRSYLRWAR